MAGKGGGAWKVAYADFVTAMMAFFMVMWLTSQKEGVKEAVAGYFREPFAIYKSTEKGSAATASQVAEPMYGHDAQPQKRALSASGDDTDYQFTVLFPVGRDELAPDQRKSIAAFAPSMTGKLNRIEVRAHCLRRPLPKDSPYKDHWELCYAQCRTVQSELESLGVEGERIRLAQAEGNEPLALNLAPDELKLNSRVDVILLRELADVPGERRPAKSRPAAAEVKKHAPPAGHDSHAPAHDDSQEAAHKQPQDEAHDSGHGGSHGESDPKAFKYAHDDLREMAEAAAHEESHEGAHAESHEDSHEDAHAESHKDAHAPHADAAAASEPAHEAHGH